MLYDNRLTAIAQDSSDVAAYSYDGTGKRVQSVEDGIETNYLYDGLTPIVERDASGRLTAQVVRGTGMGGGIGSVISRNASFVNAKGKTKFKKLYYHYDGFGNVVKLSNKKANGAGRYAYDAFGNVLSKPKTNTENNPYRFSTKETDSTGLVFFGARLYNPKIGRWITKDPMGYIDGPNPYLYVGNNPVNYIDPWGLCGEKQDGKFQLPAPIVKGTILTLDLTAAIISLGEAYPPLAIPAMIIDGTIAGISNTLTKDMYNAGYASQTDVNISNTYLAAGYVPSPATGITAAWCQVFYDLTGYLPNGGDE